MNYHYVDEKFQIKQLEGLRIEHQKGNVYLLSAQTFSCAPSGPCIFNAFRIKHQICYLILLVCKAGRDAHSAQDFDDLRICTLIYKVAPRSVKKCICAR
jgi:hypothetical protein